jgi:hypothetical protein
MQKHGVRCLLMGGQACVFYGAAEFSRDVDFAVFSDSDNLQRLQNAMDELQADVIAVPPFHASFLHLGLAVHFRCQAAGVEGMRVDVMTHMRGVDPFPLLWERRTTIAIDHIEADLLSLPDLVNAKKTQRSKDWPMIQRLIEAHWFQHRHEPTPERINFWLRECRTVEILFDLVERFPGEASSVHPPREAVSTALRGNREVVEKALDDERLLEIAADQAYWAPLRKEIEHLRRISKRCSPQKQKGHP